MSVTRVTFLEPNVDVLHNFSSNLNKKALMKLNQDKIEDIRLQQIPFSQNGELHKKTYKLKIIEQPQQCRTSGLTGKDRRPIDPAPIIKLTILDEKNVPERSNPDVIFYILHVSIWSADNSHQYDLVEGCDSESVMLLMGTLVSSALLLKDLNNNPGIFFSFPDLSIRIANNYRLKFSLLDLRR
ncbi:velvet factor-domain-containing protein [Pilobolus umbonatus]|nr:velvet factor-domain-containing protein [Pilobolus umbonatus]